MGDMSVETAPRSLSPAKYRRNLILFFADYATYDLGISFIDTSTILPAFVGLMSGSEVLVGLSGLIFPLGWTLPQIFTAGPVARAATKKPWLIWPLLIGRFALLGSAIMVLVAPYHRWGEQMLWIFLVSFAAFSVGNGMSMLAWVDIVDRSLSPKHRSWLFSFGQLTWAVGMLIAAPIGSYVLGPSGPEFPRNYGILFFLAAIMTLLEAGILWAVHEPPNRAQQRHDEGMNYPTYIGKLLRGDAAYRRFLFTRLVTDMSYMSLPFLIGFSMEYAGMGDETAIGVLLSIGAFTRVLSAFGMSWLHNRSGAKAVIVFMTIMTTLAQAWGLSVASGILPPQSSPVTYVLLIASVAGFMIGYLNWLMDRYTGERQTAYVGLTNTLGAISTAAMPIGGMLLSATGYPTLFGIGLLFALMGLAGAIGLERS